MAQNTKWQNISTVDYISEIREEGDSLWIATNGGLVNWNRNTLMPTFFTQKGIGGLMTSIECMEIDQNGTKWLGTADMGLVVYKGNSITVKNSFLDPAWRYNKLIDIAVDQNNNKWIATSGPVLMVDQTLSPKEYHFPEAVEVTCIAVDSSNTKWVGTKQGLYKMTATSFEKVFTSDNILHEYQPITSLAVGKNGILWIGSTTASEIQGGLISLSGNSAVKYSKLGYEVTCIHVDKSGIVTVGASGRIVNIEENVIKEINSSDNPKAVFRDKSGQIWVGSSISPMLRKVGSTIVSYDIRNSAIQGNNIGKIRIENGDDAWISSGTSSISDGGLTNYKDGKFLKYDYRNSSYVGFNITALNLDSRGNVWIGNAKGDITQYDRKTFKSYSDGQAKFTYLTINNIEEGFDKNIWVTANSLYKYDWSSWSLIKGGLAGGNMLSSDFDNNGVLWVGTELGLYKYNGAWSRIGNSIHSYTKIHAHPNGPVWLSSGDGLEKYDGNAIISYTTNNSPIPNNSVTAITTDSNGVVWAGLLGGFLVSFDGRNWAIYSPEKNGIPSTIITSIAVDSKGNKWIGTQHGLVLFNESGVKWDLPVIPLLNQENSIFTPRIGQAINACTNFDITLEKPLTENATVWFSSDDGLTWEWNGNMNKGDNKLNTYFKYVNSSQCRIRLITEQSNDTISGGGTFRVNYSGNKSIVFSSPTENEIMLSGETKTLSWSFTGAISNVRLFYSRDNGKSWGIVANNISNTGKYNWVIPNEHSRDYLIRIDDLDCTIDIIKVKVTDLITSYTGQAYEDLSPIYPNPAKDGFYVNDLLAKEPFVIFDETGKEIVFEKRVEGSKVFVKLSEYSKGIIFIKSEGLDKTYKIILKE